MIFTGFSITKLLSGFAVWKGDKLGKLIFQILVIAVCLWLFWARFIRLDSPTTNTTTAGTIQNISQGRSHLIQIELGIFKIKLL